MMPFCHIVEGLAMLALNSIEEVREVKEESRQLIEPKSRRPCEARVNPACSTRRNEGRELKLLEPFVILLKP
jgi:hypothetical protein